MPQATLAYVLSHIKQNVPPEILELAFKPRKYNTTVEQRIISEIIEGPILLDTNLVGGKRRDILMQSSWRMNLRPDASISLLGNGTQSAYYLVPPEAREDRNISSVIGVSSYLGSSFNGPGSSFNGAGFGNTATGMLSEMLNTRTMANYPTLPQLSLEGTYIICFTPELMTDGTAVSVMLENDSEFLNLNTSSLLAMQKLCLCAVQRYIGTNLRVSIDETEIVAGMEIGVIKTIVDDCREEGKQYNDLLIKLKGAMTYDPRRLSQFIRYAL